MGEADGGGGVVLGIRRGGGLSERLQVGGGKGWKGWLSADQG